MAFSPAIHNGFTDWDDPPYVTENYLIRDLSWNGIQTLFSSYVEGNYHPLTMTSLALDYHFWKLNPMGYHITNIVFHALNTVAVFWLVVLLTRSRWMAVIASLFFGIHPLHVESVAWVSGRKDVLYAFFYLTACISYVMWIREGRRKAKYYLGALGLFILSLLSKGMAVALPLTLVAIDFYCKREVSLKTALLEKIPFLLLALVFGVVAVGAQAEQGAVQELALFSFYERLLFACYGILLYLFRAVAPVGLSAFYPYPLRVGGGLPPVFYIAPFVVAIIAAAVYWSTRRGNDVAFGAIFFLLNVALVLQVFPVGSAITADRYTYVSYVGVGFIIASGFRYLIRGPLERHRKMRTAVIVSLAMLGAISLFAARARCEVWKDNITLWTDVIGKYPTLGVAYSKRARSYMQQGQFDRAMSDLERGLSLDPEDQQALTNRGTIWFLKGNDQKALADLDKAIRLKRADAAALNSRGAVRFDLGEHDRALEDFNTAIKLKKDYAEALLNRAVTLSTMKEFDRSLTDYDAYIKLRPGNARAYLWRGNAELGLENISGAIEDYGHALRIDPNFGDANLARSKALEVLKQHDNVPLSGSR